MLTSTEIGSIANIVGEEKAVEFVARAGFDAWDLSLFNMALYDWENKRIKSYSHPLKDDPLKLVRKLRRIGEEHGIHCNQSHAPFPTCCREIRDTYKLAIECTAEAGGSICVIHPDNLLSPEKNAQIYFELLPFAKSCGVSIATENMWNWSDEKQCALPAACSSPESINAHLDAVNDDYFVACLDIGHAEMFGVNTSAPEMIRSIGKRLKALHIHDNDKIHDSHNIPFSMNINFEAVVEALKEIEYNGYLTLEADRYLGNIGANDPESVFKGVCDLYSAAEKIAKMF